MPILIKPMETPAETEGKAYVHWKAWQETYRGLVDAAYLDRLTLEKCVQTACRWPDNILVAKDGDTVIGFVGYGACRDGALPQTGEIFALYVLGAYQGKKIGYALVQAALQRLAACRQVALWVLKGNTHAICFYEKCGFRLDGTAQTVTLGQENTELRAILPDPQKTLAAMALPDGITILPGGKKTAGGDPMLTLTEMTHRMIDFYEGNVRDIEHFLKVHAYAALLGRMEGLDEKTQATLEMAAIVHDIACPLCRQKYGDASGIRQEQESEALLRPFLAAFALEDDVRERIIYLVTHHHTVEGICGADYQMLIEADFLVNAAEGGLDSKSIRAFRDRVAKTPAAKQLLESIYLR